MSVHLRLSKLRRLLVDLRQEDLLVALIHAVDVVLFARFVGLEFHDVLGPQLRLPLVELFLLCYFYSVFCLI